MRLADMRGVGVYGAKKGKVFTSTGILRYRDPSRVTLDVDAELARYYRSLIPKAMPVQPTRWSAHITVVRGGKEPIPEVCAGMWKRHEGELVLFHYAAYVHFDRGYYWLNTWSPRLSEIRYELGLPLKSRWTRPPPGWECFHVTVGNAKFPGMRWG